MEDKEFQALVSLLDDNDPEVSEHVWEKLSALGREGILRLEAEWEKRGDPTIQSRIEDLIHAIYTEDVTRDLLAWRKAGGKDLLEGWILLTRFLYPELDAEHYRHEINRLVNKTWLEVNSGHDSLGKLRVLNHILFASENYRPDRKTMRLPNHFLVNHLMDTKKGNSHSLGVLYLLISQKLEFPVSGIILPGYFILYFLEGAKEFYIDVFNGGVFFSRSDLKRHLKQFGVEEKPAYFKPTSNIYIILEMITGMIEGFKAEGEDAKAAGLEKLFKDIEIKF